MDYVDPKSASGKLISGGVEKAEAPASVSLVRGALACGVLALAVAFACQVAAESQAGFAGALVFPVAFSLIIVTGLELFTATSAVTIVAAFAGRTPWASAIRASTLVYLGNAVGGLLLAGLLWASATYCGADPSAMPMYVAKITQVATAKVSYSHHGSAGMATAIIKGFLCNFMLCGGVVLATHSTSAIGKLISGWITAIVFFGMSFEHVVINMFVLPVGMMLGAKVTVAEALVWNVLPVTIGNTLGGVAIVGLFCWVYRDGWAVKASMRTRERGERLDELAVDVTA
jgi:formate/nitrite transporter